MYECQKYDVTYGENNSIFRIRFDRYVMYEKKLFLFDKQHATFRFSSKVHLVSLRKKAYLLMIDS